MLSAVLCEGKTDAILLSYFLIRQYGWTFSKKSTLKMGEIRENEMINWYTNPQKPDRGLVIWGVGGINDIPEKLKDVINRTRNERNREIRFDRVIIYFDRDTRTIEECRELLAEWYQPTGVTLPNNFQLDSWVNVSIELASTPPELHALQLLSTVIPPNEEGCLEVFLANAIKSASDDGGILVEAARDFIQNVPAQPYLLKARYRSKACLGSILSVMSPDWVFSHINERLLLVQWENLIDVQEVFSRLADL